MSETHWSLGVLIGGPFAALLILGVGVFTFVAWRHVRADGFHQTRYRSWTDWAVVAVWSSVVLAVILLATFALYFPFKSEYHQWRPVEGTVADVSSRLLGANKSTTQRFVVQFEDGRERACDDTRCSLVKPGDFLALACKRAWQFAGESGYDCNYVARRGGADR